MDIKTKEMYSEIYSILEIMEEEYVKKIPKSLYDLIKENRLETYNPVYNPEENLADQRMSKDTASLLVLLKLNYWCENEAEKEEIRSALKKNSEDQARIMREKYSSANMFKQFKHEEKNVKIEENNIVKYEKEGFFQKFFKKIFGKK